MFQRMTEFCIFIVKFVIGEMARMKTLNREDMRIESIKIKKRPLHAGGVLSINDGC